MEQDTLWRVSVALGVPIESIIWMPTIWIVVEINGKDMVWGLPIRVTETMN